MKKIIPVFLLFISMTACDNYNITTSNINNKSISLSNKYSVSGKVDFENSTKQFKTKATLSDIGVNGTVSLIYPPNHPTKANKTIATGLTNEQGQFTINPLSTFVPELNEIFTLEAVKRVGGVGNHLLTIRTYLKRSLDGWISITTPNIYINTKTTAITIIVANNQNISPENTIGTVDVSTSSSIPSDIGTNPNIVTDEEILDVSLKVSNVLADNLDPFSIIKYNSGKYYIDQNYKVGSFAQGKVCDFCGFKNFSDVRIIAQNLKALNLSDIDFSRSNFFATDLSYSNLSNTNLTNVSFEKSSLISTRFIESNLSNTIFEDSIISGSDFTNANLTDSIFIDSEISLANFSNANLSNVDLTGQNLIGSNFINAILYNTDFKYTNLTEVNFTEQDLKNLDFTGTNLRNSILVDTDLSGLELKNIDLSGANLEGATVTGTDFTGADLSDAIWINGTPFIGTKICGSNSIGVCN